MATKVWLASPETAMESVVEGVGAAIQSSFCVGVTIDMATNKVADNGTTRLIQKREAIQALYNIIGRLTKDDGSDFG